MGIIGSVVMLGILALPPAAPQIEVGGGLSLPLAQDSETYASQYEPPFRSVTRDGTASQHLTMAPAIRPGLWGSVTWFPRRRLGIEARAAYAHAPVSGTNGPYTISLAYESRQPPDYVSRRYEIQSSMPWPETEGHVDALTFSGSLVGLLGNPGRLSLRASGGLALTSTSGEFAPLGFTTFELGGHAVLFANDYRLRMRVERTWTAGFDGGAELALAFDARLMLTAGLRARLGPAARARVSVAEVDTEGGLPGPTAADVDAALSAPTLRWRPAPLTFVAGVRVRI